MHSQTCELGSVAKWLEAERWSVRLLGQLVSIRVIYPDIPSPELDVLPDELVHRGLGPSENGSWSGRSTVGGGFRLAQKRNEQAKICELWKFIFILLY